MRGTAIAGAGLLSCVAFAPSLAAEPSATDTQYAGIETVIVTARKISENQQSVPISITAFTQAELDRLDVKTVEDLKYVSPSVYIAPTTFRQDTLNVTIRGQRNFDSPSGGGNPGLAFDPSTAIYVDGVYYARAVGLTGSLFDLDHVEVLKGPQGTLVGRNSTGGAILFETRQPTGDFGGYAKTTVGDYGQYGLEGAINIPLSDNLFFRAALSSTGQKGYLANHFTDPASGFSNHQPAMGTQKLAGRFALKWVADDSLSITLRADISAEHDTGSSYHDLGAFTGTVNSNGRASVCNISISCLPFTDLLGHAITPYYSSFTATSVGPANPAAPSNYNTLLNSVAREQTYGFWSVEQAVSDISVGHYQTVSATVDKQLPGDIDVKWLSSYRWWDNEGTAVSRGQPYESNTYDYSFPNYQSWQSEVTATGKALDQRLQWTTGLFFFEENSPSDGGYLYQFLPSAAGPPTAAVMKQLTITDGSRNGERNTSYAAYAQATYTVIEGTRVTAGVRYTLDERAANLATQTIRTPQNPASPALLANSTYNAAPVIYRGISYAGQDDACTLTNPGGVLLPLSQCGSVINKSFHKPTWTLAIDHDLFDKTMIYFTMRSGYRSGAINTAAVNPLVTIAQPEEVIDYEAGVKSDWDLLGIPVRANIDGYQTSYHNIQLQQGLINATIASGPTAGSACTQALFNASQCTGTTTDNVSLNAKSARIYGVEWDVTMLPIPRLMLNFSGSYIDPWYTDFTFSVPPGYLQPAGGLTNLSGTPVPVPRWQTNYTATYSFGGADIGDVSIGDMSFTAHYYWQSRYLADLRNYNPAQRTSPYGIVNLQFTLANFGRSGADITFFTNNAASQKACLPEYNGVLNSAPQGTFGTPGTSGVLQCVPLAPRESGVTLGYKF